MKLHLPAKLLSALVAAAAALGAAPASAAITGWDITGWTGYDETTQSVTVGTTTTEEGTTSTNVVYATLDPAQTWNSSWSVVVSADASTLDGALTLMGLNMTGGGKTGLSEGATMGSSTSLTLTTWTTAAINGSVDFSSYDNVVFVMSRDNSNSGLLSLSAYNSANLVKTLTVLTQTGQSFGGYQLLGVVFGGKGDKVKYDNSNNHVTFADDSAVGSYSITNAGYSAGSMASGRDLADFLYGADRKTLTWDGGASGEWSAASWRDDSASGQNFGAYDSAVLGTEGAVITLTGTTPVDSLTVNANTTIDLAGNNLNAFELNVAAGKELSLSGSGTVDISSLTDVSINATDASATITTNTVSNSTVKGNATLVTGSIRNSTLEGNTTLTGTTLGNSTIKGTLTLTGNERVGLSGTVTLDSVVNNLTASTNGYAFVDNGTGATLTFTGTTDLTKTSSGSSSNFSRIGLNGGTLIVEDGASLTTASIVNSTGHLDQNAAVVVKEGGSLSLVGDSSDNQKDSYLTTLTNEGTITSTRTINVYNNVTNSGTLKAATLAITNTGSLTSDLGGTVDVDTLNLKGGTATVIGNVTAGTVGGTANTTLNGSGTLTLDGSSTASSASNLSGNVAIVKTGSGTQSFTGDTSTYAGSLTLSGGTLNLANMGENSHVTNVSISSGATLGLYKAAITDASTDVETTLNLTSLVVGAGGGTLNANLILGSGSELTMGATLGMGSALTLNGTLLKGDLFDSLMNGTVTSITLFTGVDELYIGESVEAITTDYIFTGDDMAAAFTNNLDASVYQVAYAAEGGLVTMSLVPEPATATLSLLALAALCARRRRK